MPAKVEWILCDLGQTLVKFEHMRAARNLIAWAEQNTSRADNPPALTIEALYRFMFETPPGGLSRNWRIDRGEMDMAELAGDLRNEFGLHITGRELTPLFADIFTETIPETLDAMKRARSRGTRVALCSSTNSAHWQLIMREYPELTDCWDEVFLSFRMGLLKTEPEFFPTIARTTGAAPEAHLFIDDLQANLDAARHAGMQAMLFDGSLPSHPLWD